jgi:predicted nucleotidyltransferase
MTIKNKKIDIDITVLKSILEQEQNVTLAILFGSMATGNYNINSDIDLAVKKVESLSTNDKIHLIEKITQATGRAVDLIDLSTVGEPLLGQILKQGKRLIGSNKDYANLALQHIYAQADFVPYIERTLKERRQKWINS